jgi:hypothetical protein
MEWQKILFLNKNDYSLNDRSSMDQIKIIDITPDNILKYGICGYKNPKKEGFLEKVNWIKKNYPLGLRIKSILSATDGIQGMIEYIPGEYCWRPVDAAGYIFIHCLFAGFKNIYKGKGYAGLLLDECIRDADNQEKYGVAIVTRKGSFMAGNKIFLKRGFEIVDTALPDFELMVKRFSVNAPLPEFKVKLNEDQLKSDKALRIIKSDQCPYTVKNVHEISKTSKEVFGIQPEVIINEDYRKAQESPCAFGSFCIIYNQKIISYHPVSNTRFVNIMNSVLNGIIK